MNPEVRDLRLTLDGLRAGVLEKRGGRTTALLLAVIEETARHAGHADIIREQIDGRTGR